MNPWFSIKEAIRFGWHTTKAHSKLVFQFVLTLFVLQVVSAIVQNSIGDTVLGGLAAFALSILSVFIGTGVTLISLKLARNEETQYQEIVPPWRIVLRFVVSGLCAGVLAMIPLAIAAIVAFWQLTSSLGSDVFYHSLALMQDPKLAPYILGYLLTNLSAVSVVVGITAFALSVYIGLRYCMSRYEILDGARIVESLHKSAALTEGIKWKLLGFLAILALLNMVGAILLLVGLLVTIPVSLIAFAHVYTKLKAHHHGHTS